MTGHHRDAAELTEDLELSCEIVIVGSGAGGSVLAARLTAMGHDVVVLEEGGYRTAKDFQVLDEAHNYPMLYQERMTRSTADLAISILQGRSVGGGTTVNWTTCFRTPERVFEHWADRGLVGWSREVMDPHFQQIEERLSVAEWPEGAQNANNDVLRRGAEALGWHHEMLRRNVRGCANSGYCGFGCPYDAKQAMHLTTIPDALRDGLRLVSNCKVMHIEHHGEWAKGVEAVAMDPERDRSLSARVSVRADVVVVAGGAINSPALLLRSGIDSGPVGARTFLHPVACVPGLYPHKIAAWDGAPQSVSSHEFVDRGVDKVGYFMELAPLHPVLASTSFPLFGAEHGAIMASLKRVAAPIALHIDGFVEGDEGGTVSLRSDGRIQLDYPFGEPLREAMRASHRSLAELHLAAGAELAMTLHGRPIEIRTSKDLAQLNDAPFGALEHSIFSAHQMGGCAMGEDPETSVVSSELRHHRFRNLHVVDGSVLPTSLGVNPSETIYGIAHRGAEFVVSSL